MNEQEIIQMLQKADTREKAFEQVVREYQEPIYWQIRRLVLNHEDADDVRTLRTAEHVPQSLERHRCIPRRIEGEDMALSHRHQRVAELPREKTTAHPPRRIGERRGKHAAERQLL